MFRYKNRADGVFKVETFTETVDTVGRRTLTLVRSVDVYGRLYSMSTEERIALGNSSVKDTDVTKKFRCAHFPGDKNSRITAPDGTVWRVVGDPIQPTHARIKREDVVTLRKVSA